jgi:hypothetical protein
LTSRREQTVAVIVGLACAAAALGMMLPHRSAICDSLPWVLLCSGVATMPLVGLISGPAGRRTLLVLTVVECVGLVAVCHTLGLKTYAETPGTVGARQLGIDPDYRVLPLSRMAPAVGGRAEGMQQYGLFSSATMNGYDSASGIGGPLMLKWYQSLLEHSVEGVLPRAEVPRLLNSRLLRSFNVRYVIVGKNDAVRRAFVASAPGYRLVRDLPFTLVYDNGSALPKAHFATHLFTGTRGKIIACMIDNAAPPTSAFLDPADFPAKEGVLPAAEVSSADWQPNRVALQVRAPKGGYLMISMTYYPEWKAAIDGRPAAIYRTNGVIQGLFVPPGAQRVVISYHSKWLTAGFGLAAISLIAMAILLLQGRRLFRHENALDKA